MRVTAVLVAVALSLGGCGGGSRSEISTDAVVTTGVVMDIYFGAVDSGSATLLVPLGSDPHGHELTPAGAALIFEAELVVAVGGGFEQGFADVLDAAGTEGVRVIELVSVVDPILRDGVPDPHFWLDPTRVDQAVRYLAEELGVEDELGLEVYSEALRLTDTEVREMLAGIPGEKRKIVTGHDFLAYFADRYGLEIAGVIVPGGTHHAEPSSEHLAEIVEVINREMITAIFIDAGESRALAEAVAAEADHPVEIVELQVGAIPDVPLTELIRITGERIASALAG